MYTQSVNQQLQLWMYRTAEFNLSLTFKRRFTHFQHGSAASHMSCTKQLSSENVVGK